MVAGMTYGGEDDAPFRHSRANGNLSIKVAQSTWIPAYAGMTVGSGDEVCGAGCYVVRGGRVNEVKQSCEFDQPLRAIHYRVWE